MRLLGIFLVIICCSQTLFAQPLEGRRNSGFCSRISSHAAKKPCVRLSRSGRYLACRSTATLNKLQPLYRCLPCFNAIVIQGDIDLQLSRARGKNALRLSAQYPELNVNVSNNTLYLQYSRAMNSLQLTRPCLKLALGQLNQLNIAGNSCVRGNYVNTNCGLTITHCGGGSVCLNGPVHLCKVVTSNAAKIYIRNVDSNQLDIVASGRSYLDLGGHTNLFQIRAFQHAAVNAGKLPACKVMVQADDEACVTVRPIRNLQAFANTMSNIFYYGEPFDIYVYKALSGNVLPLGR